MPRAVPPAAWSKRRADRVADLVGAEAKNVTFTSGATEANMLALTPAIEVGGRKVPRDRLFVSAIEHPSVRSGGRFAADQVEELPVTARGLVDLVGLKRALGERRAAAGFRDARQQRNRRDSADRGNCRHRARRRLASCMSTPCRARDELLATSRRLAPTCCRFPRTSSAVRRARARSFAAATSTSPSPDQGRRAGARPARGNRERRRDCRLRRGRDSGKADGQRTHGRVAG